MEKYLFLADGKSPHTLKWISEINKYYNVYIISFNGFNKSIIELLGTSKCIDYSSGINRNGGNYKYLLNLMKITKKIKDINPLVVNSHYITSYGLIGSLIKYFYIKKMNLVLSAWGTDVLVTPNKNIIYRLLTKFILKNSTLITSDSFYMSDEIKKIYNHNNILSFPFGINSSTNQTIDKQKIIFSNRALYTNYNIYDIIKWYSQSIFKEYKLIIANDGNLKKTLIDLVDSLELNDRVEFVGFLNSEEQNYYYSVSEYYISIPSSDSTSVSLLEAMNCGCIPILSNIPANREWIIDHHNGLFFNDNLALPLFNNDVVLINKDIIKKRAVFKSNINYFIRNIKKVCNI